VLAAVLDPSRLPTPPAVALQIIQTASRPNCKPSEISALLSQDPALCAKILRAVNSCLYGLSKPVGSLDRAILTLGLNTIRTLALGLSLPATQGRVADPVMHSYWLASVSGAILARELAVRIKHPCPDDDLVAGLLRDMGTIMMHRTYPGAWKAVTEQEDHRLPERACEIEEAVFGVSHAEVTAELLRGWKMPEDTVEPIRRHHQPNRPAAAAPPLQTSRAQLLFFVECLTQLDAITQNSAALDQFMTLARDKFNMTQPALVSFLQTVVPKIDAFAELLNLDIGQCPDFARILCDGSEALMRLTVEANRTSLSSNGTRHATNNRPMETMDMVLEPGSGQPRKSGPTRPAKSPGDSLPEFREAFIEHFPPGGCRLDAYELQQRLGRGSMGLVYKAYERGLDRHAAVKILSPHLAADPTARERFAREAKTSAAIRHENVVFIYTVGESNGCSYLAMEYVDGGTLQDLLEKTGAAPIATVARVAREAAAGLAAAHARQIIHRDVKPANILMESGTGRVKLSDFGLARAANQGRLSSEGSLVGTPLFMAPEQIEGYPIDCRTDLFALGGVLYILATAELPFPGENVTEVLTSVCEVEPVPPRQLRPEIPEWMEVLILRLLRKKPNERIQTAAEIEKLVKAKCP
jgi:HD-like signal output (HDOD) protein